VSVFAGGFTLAAAEQVTVDDETVTAADVLALLGSLVAKSIVIAEDTNAGSRYRLLETMREYARKRLTELDDPERVRSLHAAHVLALVEGAAPLLKGSDDQIGAARIDAEQDNLRVALGWLRDHDADAFVRLVREVWVHWHSTANFREMSQWTQDALDHAAGLPSAARAEVLAFAGVGANYANRFEDAIGLYEESIQCSRDGGLVPVPMALASLGIAELEINRPEDAIAHCEAGVEAARATGDLFSELFAMSELALACSLGGDQLRGVAVSDEVLTRSRRLGNRWLTGIALSGNGITRVLDEPEMAIELLEESARTLPTSSNVGQSCFFSAIALLRLGRPADAARMLRAALPHMKETGSDFFTGTVIATAASVLARVSPVAAAELLGALERLRKDSGMVGAPRDIDTQQRTRARLERSLDPVQLADALTRGAELTIPEAADLAHAELGKLE
jgi:tetratricopeptide (TPR) repeat protein